MKSSGTKSRKPAPTWVRYLFAKTAFPSYHTGSFVREICDGQVTIRKEQLCHSRAEAFLYEIGRTFSTWGKIILACLLILSLGYLEKDRALLTEMAAESPIQSAIALAITILCFTGLRFMSGYRGREFAPFVHPGWRAVGIVFGCLLGSLMFCALYTRIFQFNLNSLTEGWFPFLLASLGIRLAVCIISTVGYRMELGRGHAGNKDTAATEDSPLNPK